MQVSDDAAFNLPASVTLRSAPDLREAMLERLGATSQLTINCAALEEADLSLLQLIVALRKSGAERGATIALKHPAGGPLQQLLARAGFITAPAGDPGNDDLFWLEGITHHG
jgi:kynureninase